MRLLIALYNLANAIIARPKKVTPPPTQIHWSKADKPIAEMSKRERKEFAEKVIEGTLRNLGKD